MTQLAPDLCNEVAEFEVELARSRLVVPVRHHETILAALWRAGCRRRYSCRAGICGTCRTPYIGGEPDHRDHLLSADERDREVLICISRSRSPRLTLDI